MCLSMARAVQPYEPSILSSPQSCGLSKENFVWTRCVVCTARNVGLYIFSIKCDPSDLPVFFAASYYSFMASFWREGSWPIIFRQMQGCRMTRSISFFFQMMPKVRGEWPEATAALQRHTGLISCKTDISYTLLLLNRPLKTLTVCCMLFPTCTYLAFYEFEVIFEVLTVYNLVHNHWSKDK